MKSIASTSWVAIFSIAVSCTADAGLETAKPSEVVARAAAIIKLEDPGYSAFPSYLADVNADGWLDFCRVVGNYPDLFVSCDLGRENGFDPDQYGFNSPLGLDFGYSDMSRWIGMIDLLGPATYCRYVRGSRELGQSCCTILRNRDYEGQAYGAEQYERCVLSEPTPPPSGNGSGNGNGSGSGSGPTQTPPQPINQPVDASCECEIAPGNVIRSDKTLCFARIPAWQIDVSIRDMCANFCVRLANNNWETEEGAHFQYSGNLLGGDCTQTFDSAGF